MQQRGLSGPPPHTQAEVAVDWLWSGTIWSEEHSRDWKTENPWLDSWLCATRGWNSIRTPLVCTLVFFSLPLLSSFFFLQSKGFCWSWGCEADKEHSSGGPRRPFLTHLSVALSLPPPSLGSLSPTTSAPLSPFPLDSFLLPSMTRLPRICPYPQSPPLPRCLPPFLWLKLILVLSFAPSPSHPPSARILHHSAGLLFVW